MSLMIAQGKGHASEDLSRDDFALNRQDWSIWAARCYLGYGKNREIDSWIFLPP